MLTEEQAREKWCPMARVVEIGDGELHGPFNRYHPDGALRIPVAPNSCRCIASECMAWRSVEEHEERRIAADSPEAATINQGYVTIDGGTWFIDHSRSDLDTFLVVNVDLTAKRGYCGAFGRPGDAP